MGRRDKEQSHPSSAHSQRPTPTTELHLLKRLPPVNSPFKLGSHKWLSASLRAESWTFLHLPKTPPLNTVALGSYLQNVNLWDIEDPFHNYLSSFSIQYSVHLILKVLLLKTNPKHIGCRSHAQLQNGSHWYQFLLISLDFKSSFGVWDLFSLLKWLWTYNGALTLVWLNKNKNYRRLLF